MFEMKWFGPMVEQRVDEGAANGAEQAGQRVLARAQSTVPLLSGALRDTGRVDSEHGEATISYATHYAAILHEHPEWDFRNGRDGHWLLDALNASGADVTDAYGDGIRAKL